MSFQRFTCITVSPNFGLIALPIWCETDEDAEIVARIMAEWMEQSVERERRDTE